MTTDSNVKVFTTGLDPIHLLSLKSADEYEALIREWANSYLKKICGKYVRVERLGGSGDMGRDVVCTIDKKSKTWDNYQCKHYSSALTASNVWLELGKICYYSFLKKISCPEHSYFVAPKGVTVTLRDLLQNPDELKSGLMQNWDKHCKKKITKATEIKLEGNLKAYVEAFDFSIFDYISPDEFIEQVEKTPYFKKHFGHFAKVRKIADCPDEIKDTELEYIRKILEAYSDKLKMDIHTSAELEKYPDLKVHFNRQRLSFYEAETLKEFSRDGDDPEDMHFEKFSAEIYDGIIEEIEDDAEHGFERLKKVLKRAEQIQVTNNPLSPIVKTKDRHGVCHHLANEKDEVKWVK